MSTIFTAKDVAKVLHDRDTDYGWYVDEEARYQLYRQAADDEPGRLFTVLRTPFDMNEPDQITTFRID